MFDFLNKIKLGTRINGLVALQVILLIIVSCYALLKIHHLELEIEELGEENVPLIEDVSKIMKEQLNQALRFGEILQFSHTNKKEKFNKAIEEFKDAGKNMHEIIKDGKERSKHGVKMAKENGELEEEKEFKTVATLFQRIEKEHSDYQHHCEELFAFLEKEMSNKISYPGAEENHESHGHEKSNNILAMNEPGKRKKATSVTEAMENIEHEVKGLEDELVEIMDHIDKITKNLTKEAKEEQATAFRTLIILIIISLGGGGFISVLVSNITINTIKNAINNLSSGAQEVTSASNDIAQTSTQLAENAAKQAASIEETSASLEEVSASSNENSEATKVANELIQRSDKIVQNSTNYINNLSQSSEDMLNFSDKIAILIRTFNEFSNQLHILSTNATAEATRSEASKGFAVFTIEIKKLVGQLIEKAQEANKLVDSSLRDIKKGFEISDATRKDFKEIAEISSKLKEIVEGVNNASIETDQSISEINIAVATISDVTQASAATSEESAAASEELNAQAETMMQVVDELVSLVGKNKY